MPAEDFAALRAKNIAANKALLATLGLEKPTIPQRARPAPKNAPSRPKKRKIEAVVKDDSDAPIKLSKVASEDPKTDASAGSLRRSSRHSVKPRLSYNESNDSDMVENMARTKAPKLVSSVAIMALGRENVGNRLGTRLHDPKSFGSIPGIEVGTWWETRAECSTDAVHAPFVAGISGNAAEGAYSVALSGGYDDDVDLGYAFTYTGSGGRDLKGTKMNPKNLRTAPQSCDQTFDNAMNAALKTSVQTKRPIRVIRGYKLDSPYAPESGYRYDGLYTVEKAWMEPGLNKQGYKVCKFAFKRIPGQLPLPMQEDEEDNQDAEEEERTDAA